MKEQDHLTWFERLQNRIWHLVYPIYPKLEHFFLPLHEGKRQRFHLGWLAHGKTLQDLEKHLHDQWGFGNHFIAWEDKGQVLSWRKLVDFEHQYHIRVFDDGEIRGHYEYTPEAKPVSHFEEVGETPHKKEFEKFLAGFVVKQKHPMHLLPDVNVAPESEITVEDMRNKS